MRKTVSPLCHPRTPIGVFLLFLTFTIFAPASAQTIQPQDNSSVPPNPLEIVEILATQEHSPTLSTISLAAGVNYTIWVSGVYRYDRGEIGQFADAQYRENDFGGIYRWNSVEFNGRRLSADNTAFNPTSEYRFSIIGDGEPLALRIYDEPGQYYDNEGTLTAYIYDDSENNLKASIAGRFLDFKGDPLPNQNILLLEQENVLLSTTTSNDGSFVFENLPLGRYQVSVLPDSPSSPNPFVAPSKTIHISNNSEHSVVLEESEALQCKEAVAGICIAFIAQQLYIAQVDRTNEDIRIELAYDLVDKETGLFDQKTVNSLVQEDSGAMQEQPRYSVAINGTAKGHPDYNHFWEKPLVEYVWDVYSMGSILGIRESGESDGKAYREECVGGLNCIGQPRASFFAYNSTNAASVMSIARAGIDQGFTLDPWSTPPPYDQTAREYIQKAIEKSDFVIGYESTLLDESVADGTRITGFPEYVVKPDSDIHHSMEEKTVVGISQDGKYLFMGVANRNISVALLVRHLQKLGAYRVIKLDGGSSSQFISLTTDATNPSFEAHLLLQDRLKTRHVVNGLVAYNVRDTPFNPVDVRPSGGYYTLSPKVAIDIPNGAFPEPVTLNYTPQLPHDAEDFRDVRNFFDIYAQTSNGSLLQPATPYAITVSYDEHNIPLDAIESEIGLYFWNVTEWTKEPTSVLDIENNIVTATPSHFSQWALLTVSVPINKQYLPVTHH